MFENLESRRLFALPTATLSSGNLTIKGGSKVDVISVLENGQTPGANPSNVHVELSEPANNYFVAYDFVGVKGITINSGGAPDSIFHTGDRIHPKIMGGSGNDTLTISDNGTGSSSVDAGGGNDSITLLVGTQNPPGTTATTIHGGSGDDSIYLNTDTSGNYNTAVSKAIVFGDGGKDTITVYNGINTITGDSANDTYIIRGGTNTITDSGGTNTYLIGDPNDPSVTGGTNTITGGGGIDTFYAYNGQSTLIAGSGNDVFNTYGGSGHIDGQGGTDTWNSANGTDATYTATSVEHHNFV